MELVISMAVECYCLSMQQSSTDIMFSSTTLYFYDSLVFNFVFPSLKLENLQNAAHITLDTDQIHCAICIMCQNRKSR
jgi:hypothetical protein